MPASKQYLVCIVLNEELTPLSMRPCASLKITGLSFVTKAWLSQKSLKIGRTRIPYGIIAPPVQT